MSRDAASKAQPAPWRGRWAPAVLVVVVAAVYANSFAGAFVLDDELSILGNATIRHLWPPWRTLLPPGGQGLTVEGRPLVNLSLALNYALSGAATWSYHLFNLAIHIGAALLLFGLVRRTILLGGRGGAPAGVRSPIRGDSAGVAAATPVALSAALLWAVHPLQTESVTYIVQRTEALMGCLFLLTLYALNRAGTANAPRRWLAVSVAACALGMTAKEVMVTAPLIAFLYDRTFLTGSFRETWRRRRGYHALLAATWLPLALLVAAAGDRGGTIGPHAGIAWWQYALTQSRAVIHYLWLTPWPTPLIFDYGADFVTWRQALPYLVFDVLLLAITVRALRQRPALGFLGACFFLVLAPTSSVLGGTRQMLAEHRMYLSLVAPVILAVLALYRVLGRKAPVVVAALIVPLGFLTIRRNLTYRSELALYADTAVKRPSNVHARYNLGKLLAESGRLEAAIVEDEAAVRLDPRMVIARFNLANALSAAGRPADAVVQYEAALALKPDYARAHFNLGNALVRLGRKEQAVEHYRAAARLDPGFWEARDNLGGVLLDLGRLAEARREFEQVLRLAPDSLEAHCNLGAIAYLQGDAATAIAEYERALRINPSFAPAQAGLARVRAAGPLP